MTDELAVLIGDHLAGTVARARRDALTFSYDPGYRDRSGATPLSLAMPIQQATHPDSVVAPWLWGLLPDNSAVLERWSRTFQTSLASPFGLLGSPVGEDCAGAVRFVVPDRLDVALARTGEVEWLDDDDVAGRLRSLRTDATAWLGNDGSGRFSLAGAQAKTALLHREGRWGVPSGATATSHILKPAITGLDDHDLNEHLCLDTARRCGLPAAHSRVLAFGAERAVAVQRFDRTPGPDGSVVRVHQEDTCQALGVPPQRKYQSEGGPTVRDVATLLREHVPLPHTAHDLGRFTDALIFNWLIGGTDAHAKNYAVLLSGRQVRLAPLYDIGSALPYPGMHVRKLRLAMKFGGDYSLLARGPQVWHRLAADVGLPVDVVLGRARTLIERTPDAFADAAADPGVRELGSDLPPRLVDAVSARVRQCAAALP